MNSVKKEADDVVVGIDSADETGPSSNEPLVDDFCRVCLLKQPNLTNLVGRIDGVMIPEMLYKLCGTQIDVDDRYPRRICERCLAMVDCAFNFVSEFRQQDERLRSFYWNGPISKQLQNYQPQGEIERKNRMEALQARNPLLLVGNAKECSTKATYTDAPTVQCVDAGVNTDEILEYLTLESVKQEEDGMSEIELDDLEDDETSRDMTCDSVGARKELVSMRIDLLTAAEDQDQEVTDEESKRKQTRRSLRPRKLDNSLEKAIDLSEAEEEQWEVESQSSADGEMLPIYDDRLRCYICDYTARVADQLDRHVETHLPMLPHECTVCKDAGWCPRPLKSLLQLRSHYRSHGFPHGCNVCGKRFSTDTGFLKHRGTHHSGELVCEECGRQFHNRKSLVNHMNRHEALRKESYKCDICEKVFGNRPRLVRHLRVHTGEKPYPCRFCDRRFNDSHQQQRHERFHRTEKNGHQCESCGERFESERKLGAHNMNVHMTAEEQEVYVTERRKRYERRMGKLKDNRCPYEGCDYQAKTYGAMYVHKRSKHILRIKCDFCNKYFAFQNQLELHLKLHTGEKPYKCDICGRSFRRPFSYREHMEQHESDKKYECETCGKSFGRPRYLQAHRQTHTTEKPFACETCGNMYKTKGERKKHSRMKHGIEFLPEKNEQVEEMYIVEYV
ncbi:zinc finger protein 34-like [Anopheles bellator]|uniref:zinc finger protein 34-like n=1 Tax=Anopheles bellator TaxID=139047 RepID=UPI0026479CE5|nr:zinc finger protein 34-like [Anopheles bellator]